MGSSECNLHIVSLSISAYTDKRTEQLSVKYCRIKDRQTETETDTEKGRDRDRERKREKESK